MIELKPNGKALFARGVVHLLLEVSFASRISMLLGENEQLCRRIRLHVVYIVYLFLVSVFVTYMNLCYQGNSCLCFCVL